MKLKKFEEFTFDDKKVKQVVDPKKTRVKLDKKSNKIPVKIPSWNIY